MMAKAVLDNEEEITRIEVGGVVLIKIDDDVILISTTVGEVVLSTKDLKVERAPECLFLRKDGGVQVNLCHLPNEKMDEVATALGQRIVA